MLTRKTFNLRKRWITKPLHRDTFNQILIDNNSGTTHRMYMLANEIEARQNFLELEGHLKYSLTAVVSIKPGYASQARSQASLLGFMRKYIRQRPEFVVKLCIYNKNKMIEAFSFKHITTNEKQVYRLVGQLEKKVKNII